jgi:4-hydroxy-3-polyprenylbenzoate decarboxylase
MQHKKRLIIGITGSSGIILGIELLRAMQRYEDWETELIISESAQITMALETPYNYEQVTKLATRSYRNDDIGANVASGTYKTEAMVIIPCSMKTVAGIAIGYSENLLLRAADVIIKEQRKLIIVPRETPLSVIHLRNLLTLAELGVQIIPPVVAYYHKPETITEHNQQIIGRILDSLNLEYADYKRWQK